MTYRTISTMLVLGLAVFGFAGCGGDTQETAGDPDEAFLNEVREEAATTSPATETGDIGEGIGNPKIALETDVYEMGTIANNEIAVQRMKIYNRGDGPLKIDRVTTSCGCTTGEMEDNLIPAGGESELIIRVDPSRIPGFYANKVLTVFNNDSTNPHPTINVITHVEQEVALEPETLDFGEVPLGESAEKTVRVRQLQEAPLEVYGASVRSTLPYVTLSVKEVPKDQWADPTKREYDVVATLPETAGKGQYSDYGYINTNLERSPHVPIRILAQVKAPYDVLPQRVSVRGVNPGEQSDVVLVLQSELPISNVQVANKNEAVDVLSAPGENGKSATFKLNVPERTPSRAIRDEWTLTFQAGDRTYTEVVDVTAVLTKES